MFLKGECGQKGTVDLSTYRNLSLFIQEYAENQNKANIILQTNILKDFHNFNSIVRMHIEM